MALPLQRPTRLRKIEKQISRGLKPTRDNKSKELNGVPKGACPSKTAPALRPILDLQRLPRM